MCITALNSTPPTDNEMIEHLIDEMRLLGCLLEPVLLQLGRQYGDNSDRLSRAEQDLCREGNRPRMLEKALVAWKDRRDAKH